MLIDKREGAGFKECNYSKAFIEYSNDIDEIYENIENTMQRRDGKDWSYLMVWLLIYLAIKNLIQ